MAHKAYFKVSVAIANGLAKSGSWRTGFDRNSYFKLLKDVCASVVQSHQWSFLVRLRRGWAIIE